MTVVLYTFTYKQYTECRERNIRNNKKKRKIGKCGPCLVFASYTLVFALQLRKNHGNPSVRVEKALLLVSGHLLPFQYSHQYALDTMPFLTHRVPAYNLPPLVDLIIFVHSVIVVITALYQFLCRSNSGQMLQQGSI
jgi:surface polysaccharide O-acyltransferase-like enzyme